MKSTKFRLLKIHTHMVHVHVLAYMNDAIPYVGKAVQWQGLPPLTDHKTAKSEHTKH